MNKVSFIRKISLVVIGALVLFKTFIFCEINAYNHHIERGEVWVDVHTKRQEMLVLKEALILHRYPISSSKKGLGNKKLSEQTPKGWHIIQKKHGETEPFGMIFKYRWATGKIAKIPSLTAKDLVTSRILHLSGLEKGINNGGQVDSYARCIYIHGTNEETLIGTPSSRGCIRMKNKDIIEVFDILPEGTKVYIH